MVSIFFKLKKPLSPLLSPLSIIITIIPMKLNGEYCNHCNHSSQGLPPFAKHNHQFFSTFSAYRFQVAGYRDEKEYKHLQNDEEVGAFLNNCHRKIVLWIVLLPKTSHKARMHLAKCAFYVQLTLVISNFSKHYSRLQNIDAEIYFKCIGRDSGSNL